MAFAAYHCQKGNSSSSGGLGNHIDREEGKEHSYEQADPDKLHLNNYFKVNDYCSMDLEKAVEKRIKDAYTGKRAVRKDAVKHIDHILTGSHERMHEIFEDEKQAKDWVKANYDFISENFGKENIVRFTLHLDEKTPHIHCVTVPITEKGGLSAKEMIGGRLKLQQTQTKYGEAMKPFGLERGRKFSKATHQDTQEFYKDMREELNNREVEKNEHKNVISELSEKEKELQSTIGSLTTKDVLVNIFQPKKKLKNTEEELKETLKKLADAEHHNNNLLKKVNSDKDGITMLKSQINDYAFTLREKNKEIENLKSVKLEKVQEKTAISVVGIINRELKKKGSKEVFTVYDKKILTEERKAQIMEDNSKKTNKNKGRSM